MISTYLTVGFIVALVCYVCKLVNGDLSSFGKEVRMLFGSLILWPLNIATIAYVTKKTVVDGTPIENVKADIEARLNEVLDKIDAWVAKKEEEAKAKRDERK